MSISEGLERSGSAANSVASSSSGTTSVAGPSAGATAPPACTRVGRSAGALVWMAKRIDPEPWLAPPSSSPARPTSRVAPAGTATSITELACVPMPRATSLPSSFSSSPPAFLPFRTSPHSALARFHSRSTSDFSRPEPLKTGSTQSAQSHPKPSPPSSTTSHTDVAPPSSTSKGTERVGVAAVTISLRQSGCEADP